MWKGDADAEVGYGGDTAEPDMIYDYQQSADESDLEQDIANDDYVIEEPDDFDVLLLSMCFCLSVYLLYHRCAYAFIYHHH